MKLFKSNEPNTFHYVTLVTFNRVQHPADWKWSSCRAYLPHQVGDVPIEIDWQGYWKEEEFVAKAGGQ